MGFGNPYGDPWSVDIVAKCRATHKAWRANLSLSDTVGAASTSTVYKVFSQLIPAYTKVQFGAHLHCRQEDAVAKLEAAFRGGCRRFDGAIRGFGGCPMAKDELVGNLPTEKILSFCTAKQIDHQINPLHFESAYNVALKTYA